MFKQFALIFTAFVALLLALVYEDIIKNLMSQVSDKDLAGHTLEKEIIRSWKKFVNLPARNLERNFRIAIG